MEHAPLQWLNKVGKLEVNVVESELKKTLIYLQSIGQGEYITTPTGWFFL